MTNQERLTQIEAAISAIENGAQEYRIGNRTVRRADLKTLYDERRRIINDINAEEGYETTVASFLGR